jgi:hypothetical protein
MNKSLLIFTVTLVALTAAIGMGAWYLAQPSFLVLMLSSLSTATWIVFFFMQKTRSEDFIKNYLLTIVLKLLGGGIFVSILIYADQSGEEANAILFMVSYFLLTGLEVGFLFKRIK